MSHDALPTSPVNSGAINHISFPGSEAGVSIIELVGNVYVSGSLSSLKIRLTAVAAVAAAAAVATPVTYAKMRLPAEAQCEAVTSALALSKVSAFPSAVDAAAQASATAICLRQSGATSAPSAVGSAEPRIHTYRGASASVVAQTTVASNLDVSRSASVSAVAYVADTTSFSKILTDATVTATANQVVAAAIKHRIGATGTSTIASSINTIFGTVVGAQQSAIASFNVGAGVRLTLLPTLLQVEPNTSTYAALKIPNGAEAFATAYSDPVVIGFIRSASATTQAAAIASAAGLDFSATMPAPEERQMALPAIDRRIEVTE